MSNRTERQAIEGLMIEHYHRMLEILTLRGETPATTDLRTWPEGLHYRACQLHALFAAAQIMGMGVYDWPRLDRVISGEQYAVVVGRPLVPSES